MKLYEIAPALRFALDDIFVDEETGEILSSDALHAVEAQAAEKIEATALYLRELDAEAKAAKEEADRMLARVKSMQKRSDYLKAMLLDALHTTGKVKTGRVTVSIRTTQAVQINQEQAIPEAFTTKKITISPNKVLIKETISAGGCVPGCELIKPRVPPVSCGNCETFCRRLGVHLRDVLRRHGQTARLSAYARNPRLQENRRLFLARYGGSN